MKVAFWSNVRGKSCVTSNLACISILSILSSHYQKRTILFENHQNIFNLGSTLSGVGKTDGVRESTTYMTNRGLGRILQSVETGEQLTEESLYGFADHYLKKRLCYLPTGNIRNADMLEYRMNRDCVPVMKYLEQYGEYVFVDTSSAPLTSSRKILHQADLVVVNLSQNKQMLTHFFRNYSSIQEKAFYLIGDYDAKSELTRNSIIENYKVKESCIATIPHNVGFLDAVSEGNLITFLMNNYDCDSWNKNYEFIKQAKEAVELFHARVREIENEKICDG